MGRGRRTPAPSASGRVPPYAARRLHGNPSATDIPARAEIVWAATVPDDDRISGELQIQLMSALWRLGAGTVEQVRSELPPRYRGAYTTVQTVLNRLSERGLLTRTKVGNAMEYRPKVSEADYLSRSIARTLAGASSGARQAALARLIADLDKDELAELQRLAKNVTGKRRRR
jgi:predicted transcriptional regulator